MNTDSYHKVVDCQHACPAHTAVPAYIRLVAEGKFQEAYLLNRESNLFPGILGRVCDRPCEPACRRGRVDEKPVAICAIKRATADYKGDMPAVVAVAKTQGKRVALIGAGPTSLAVAHDLAQYGYTLEIFEQEARAGGAMRVQVPAFRLPERVLNEEIDFVLQQGVICHFSTPVKNLHDLQSQGFDAIFLGTGAPLAKDLLLPGRQEAAAHIHVGLGFLASVHFEHRSDVPKRVVVIGGGNTAMDCSRTALRLGAEIVSVIAPETYGQMLASPWEKEEAKEEQVIFRNGLLPIAFLVEGSVLVGVQFQPLETCYDAEGKWGPVFAATPPITIPCDAVILAIGQRTAFPFVDAASGVQFSSAHPDFLQVDPVSLQTTNPAVFVGGDALGPRNIIYGVASGHQAALAIHLYLSGEDPKSLPKDTHSLTSQRITLNQWSYTNRYTPRVRTPVPMLHGAERVQQLRREVETGYTPEEAKKEAARCLNCDVQTVFRADLCIECDACIDICPSQCLILTPDAPEATVRMQFPFPAQNMTQDVFSEVVPQTGRLMAKDEDVCVHCGLCAERCPTGAWDMQLFELHLGGKKGGSHGCRK